MKPYLMLLIVCTSSVLTTLICSSVALADEATFIAATQMYMEPYRNAKNELQKSALRKERAQELKAALGGKLEVVNWTGVLTDLSTNSDGDAYITVEIARGVSIRTWNNSLSDKGDRTLIKFGSSLFKALAEMEEGTRVHFSGSFFPGQDFVKEMSLTESGSMSEPEFLFRFSKVERL
jgi:hypothetical protein